jgi:hypothetical protein
MQSAIVISFPDSLPDLLQETPEEFEREARMAMPKTRDEKERDND